MEPILDRGRVHACARDTPTSRMAAAMAWKVSDAGPPGAVADADLGGSSKYSSENLED